MKQLEIDLSKKSSFRCRRKNWRTRRKPKEASLDWKPNVHKCPDRESNPGLIGAKRRKIRYANLHPLNAENGRFMKQIDYKDTK